MTKNPYNMLTNILRSLCYRPNDSVPPNYDLTRKSFVSNVPSGGL